MDLVGAVLDGHRARGAFVLRCAMRPPWAISVADRAAVTLITVQRGEVCLVPATGEPRRFRAGDTVIVKNAAPYRLADSPSTPPAVVVEPGQQCRHLGDGGPGSWQAPTGRVWGNDPEGPCGFLVGVYELAGQIAGRLLRDLPDLVHVPASATGSVTTELLLSELQNDAPGQDIVVDRLVDLHLIHTLRTWLNHAGAAAPPWWRADADPVTGAALALLHDRPDQPWSLATLAAEVGVGRATLARRFTHTVGTPPLAYLTEWRLARAADLLRTTRHTVEHIAHQVGYTNAFAFSTAFKRHYARSPREHRTHPAPTTASARPPA